MADRHYTARQIDAKLNNMRIDLLNKIDKTVVTTATDEDYINKTGGKSLILDVIKVEKEKIERNDK